MRRPLVALAGVAALAATSSSALRAHAQPASRSGGFVPSATRAYFPIATAASGPEGCAPPGSSSWTVVCGGFGRVRDLYTLASGRTLAVGDGAADYADATGTWAPQLGAGLSGLNALSIDIQEREGWAVGDDDVFAHWQASGAWRLDPQERTPSVDLATVSLPLLSRPIPNGWAGGTEDGHAAFRAHSIASDESDRWIAVPYGATELPPVLAIVVDRFAMAAPTAWAVGAWSPDRGAILRFDSRWRIAQELPGAPSELVFGRNEAWAIGQVVEGETPSLVFWRWDRATPNEWPEWTADRLPERSVLDGYIGPAEEGQDASAYLGLVPGRAGEPIVLRHLMGAYEGFEPLPAQPPAGLDGGQPAGGLDGGEPAGDGAPGGDSTDGNHALTAGADWLLYAWSDGVWRLDLASLAWRQVRDRHRLVDLAHGGGGAWAMAADEAGPALVEVGPKSVRVAGRWSAPAPRAFVDLDTGGRTTWGMDADGELWRAGGALGRWRLAATAPGFPVQKLAALDGSSAWVGGSETGHVPVFALLGHEGWEAPAPGLTAGSVVALDAASSLDAYALVAPEASGPIKARVVWVQAACAGRPCISEWRSPVNLTAVSSPAPGSAWAVGEHVVVHCAGSACTQEVPALVPAGARLVDVVAATDDDVWVAALSGKVGRESTRILRRGEAGVWSMPCGLDVPIAKLDLARSGMPGGQTLWMAGDWSTVLRLDYAVGEPVPGCD